ncbi:hypothetical protein GWI33_001802 [Rhynchophorus ferrugineus]|uniref:CHHC U11-48K-type domain-containing protein n=1 Tax=Rhynchophorus ferrugineus TaxID=354439 RepID=A0A834MLM4_RHYFE|nr:hypothetical protein GWI33_001802 [Rhynchophorus ferrugineus]
MDFNIESLGWTVKKTLETDNPKVICPINKAHLISFKTSQDHTEKCKLHSCGYRLDDQFLSEPVCNDKNSIKLDAKIKIDLLNYARSINVAFRPVWNGQEVDPMTSDRLMSNFSTDERLALYDYCLKHTEGPKKPQEFTLDLPETKSTKELSVKEKLSLERDAKRRKVKYKSVHTSKKSHTEVIREVINNQMEMYAQWIQQKQKQEKKEKEKQKKREKQVKESENHNQSNHDQYHYIETTYQNQVQDVTQWNHITVNQYPNAYVNSYYSTGDGIITDWSHAYQGVIDTNINVDTNQFNCDNSSYLESTTVTNIDYSSNMELPVHSYNGYYNQNGNTTNTNEQANNYKQQEYIKEQESYAKIRPISDKNKDRERRYDRERKRHNPLVRKYERDRRK